MCHERGELVTVTKGEQASAESFLVWREYFQRNIPLEMATLCNKYDGLTVRITSPESQSEYDDGAYFRLRSLEEMVEWSRAKVEDFFALVREEPINRELFSCERALELCSIADFKDDAELCLVDLSLSQDRCVIVDTDYEDEFFPSGLRVISDSLFEFVIRCINTRASLSEGGGFRYYWPPPLEEILAREKANRDLPRRR